MMRGFPKKWVLLCLQALLGSGTRSLGLATSAPRTMSALFLKNQCINSVVGVDKTTAALSLCESITALTQSERAMAKELQGLKKDHAQLQWGLRAEKLERGKVRELTQENGHLEENLSSVESEDQALKREASRLSSLKNKEQKSEKALFLQQAKEKSRSDAEKAKGRVAWRAILEAHEETQRARAAAATEAGKAKELETQLEAANAQSASLVAKLEAVTAALERLKTKDTVDRVGLRKEIQVLQEENQLYLHQFQRETSSLPVAAVHGQ